MNFYLRCFLAFILGVLIFIGLAWTANNIPTERGEHLSTFIVVALMFGCAGAGVAANWITIR